jgi:nitrate/nitrite-specific signal transduction histidine kinase
MSFFSNLLESVKNKQAELKDSKEYLDMVEAKAKPLRRMAYMEQMLKEVVNEGIAKAKIDAKARLPKEKKTEEDFGFDKVVMQDPMKYINQAVNKPEEKKKTKIKSKGNKK